MLLPDDGAVTAVDVRGAAPGTRETDLLRPENQVQVAHALLLTGGSAFGLAAADGVMRRLEERGVGVDTLAGRVPDRAGSGALRPRGRRPAWPDRAPRPATAQPSPPSRAADRWPGGRSVPAPVRPSASSSDPSTRRPVVWATAGRLLPDGSTVWALAAVNAVGDVVDERRRAAGRSRHRPPCPRRGSTGPAAGGDQHHPGRRRHRPALTKTHAHRLATVAHDGLAHAIRPVHTSFDGDTVFAFATGQRRTEMDPWTTLGLEVAAVDVVARAVRRAVRLSRLSGVSPWRRRPKVSPSISASQDASMTLWPTPTVTQDDSPSEVSISTRVIASVPWPWSTMRTL